MAGMTGAELARQLDITRGRVSQLVGEGKLDGCFEGTGRRRRFDLQKVAAVLGKRLDPGQMMGNGAETKKRIDAINAGAAPDVAAPPRADGPLDSSDSDAYTLARTQRAIEEARKAARQNQEAEGLFVLASEVDRAMAKALGQEIAEFESLLRDMSRAIADEFGIDARGVRVLMMNGWRTHRGKRSQLAAAEADEATMTDTERDADI